MASFEHDLFLFCKNAENRYIAKNKRASTLTPPHPSLPTNKINRYYFGWIDKFQEIFFRFDGDLGWSSEDVAKGIQDYLICIEMFIGAIVHQYVFHYTDYCNSKHSDYRVNTHRRRRVVGRRRKFKGRKDRLVLCVKNELRAKRGRIFGAVKSEHEQSGG